MPARIEDNESAEPLTARLLHDDPRGHHSGAGTTLTLRLELSEPVDATPQGLQQALQAANATVDSVRRADEDGALWDIDLSPASGEAVSVLLPPGADCEAAGAVCTPDGRTLSHAVAASIPGPPH